MASRPPRASRGLTAQRAIKILQDSKLVDLKQSVGSVVEAVGRLEDFDGYAICWLHYVFLGPGPRFDEELVSPVGRG